MVPDVRRVLEDALKLPRDARAALVGTLMDSLDPEVDEGAEAAWSDEIARRLRDLKSGAITPVPWSEARRMIVGTEGVRPKA